MNHNQLIANFKKHLPKDAFFHYWGKSKYKSAPWDCTYAYNGLTHYIEFKYKYDKLMVHQKEGLTKVTSNTNTCYTFVWVIRGGLKRAIIKLETITGDVVIEGSYGDVINYLNYELL